MPSAPAANRVVSGKSPASGRRKVARATASHAALAPTARRGGTGRARDVRSGAVPAVSVRLATDAPLAQHVGVDPLGEFRRVGGAPEDVHLLELLSVEQELPLEVGPDRLRAVMLAAEHRGEILHRAFAAVAGEDAGRVLRIGMDPVPAFEDGAGER